MLCHAPVLEAEFECVSRGTDDRNLFYIANTVEPVSKGVEGAVLVVFRVQEVCASIMLDYSLSHALMISPRLFASCFSTS